MDRARYTVSVYLNSYRNRPNLARNRPMHLSDSRCDSSSAEAEVLMALTGNGPTPPEGDTYYHRQRASSNLYFAYLLW
ncbi:hypothetical protein AVEN_242435-1 [Araneus ventricosus]|uniref:Uncharacterized protein n=1 Tax=Araneus ventricosus TaxID=182803 RepID=A0A4Y2LEZ4_ARAVE|nr:hypothetical protein AVEN_242435-1 [Araneus ventricosus]